MRYQSVPRGVPRIRKMRVDSPGAGVGLALQGHFAGVGAREDTHDEEVSVVHELEAVDSELEDLVSDCGRRVEMVGGVDPGAAQQLRRVQQRLAEEQRQIQALIDQLGD